MKKLAFAAAIALLSWPVLAAQPPTAPSSSYVPPPDTQPPLKLSVTNSSTPGT